MTYTFPTYQFHYVNLELPQYNRRIERFKTLFTYLSENQFNDAGMMLKIKFVHIPYSQRSTIETFYNNIQHLSFLLSSYNLSFVSPIILQYIQTMPFWCFEGEIKTLPFIINRRIQLYDLEFTLRGVLS